MSEMTVRRYLDKLEGKDLIKRTHGGAFAGQEMIEVDYRVRETVRRAEKEAIGRLAWTLIQPGESVFLDAGSTLAYLASAMDDTRRITVVTNSTIVLQTLENRANIDTILLGGRVHAASHSLIGPIAEETVAQFRFTKAFLGAVGINLEEGLTQSNVDEVPVKKRVAANAKEVIVLADSSKFNRDVLVMFLRLDQLHTIITDTGIPAKYRKSLEERGIRVLTAGAPPRARPEPRADRAPLLPDTEGGSLRAGHGSHRAAAPRTLRPGPRGAVPQGYPAQDRVPHAGRPVGVARPSAPSVWATRSLFPGPRSSRSATGSSLSCTAARARTRGRGARGRARGSTPARCGPFRPGRLRASRRQKPVREVLAQARAARERYGEACDEAARRMGYNPHCQPLSRPAESRLRHQHRRVRLRRTGALPLDGRPRAVEDLLPRRHGPHAPVPARVPGSGRPAPRTTCSSGTARWP